MKNLIILLCLIFVPNVYAQDEYTAELYESYCQACHTAFGSDAPRAFDDSIWSSRLERGLDVVVGSAVEGFGNMPAMGSCMECTYEDMEDLVRYMSQPK
jgi:cytochrome c5